MAIRKRDTVEYLGAVLAEESEGLEDADFFAVVWDEEQRSPVRVYLGTNAFGSSDPTSWEVDATREIRAKYDAWIKENGSFREYRRRIAEGDSKYRARVEAEQRMEEQIRQKERQREQRIKEQWREVELQVEQRKEEQRRYEAEKRIRLRREQAKLCIFCGNQLGWLDRLFGRINHPNCR